MNPNYLSIKILVNSGILSNPKDPLKTVHVKDKCELCTWKDWCWGRRPGQLVSLTPSTYRILLASALRKNGLYKTTCQTVFSNLQIISWEGQDTPELIE